MRRGTQSAELPCLAPSVRECGENRAGRKNNLMAWTSNQRWPEAWQKTHPRDCGSIRGQREEKLLSTPRPQNTQSPVRRPVSNHWPVSTKNTSGRHSSPRQHNLTLQRAERPQLACHIRFNWHTGHKSQRTTVKIVWKVEVTHGEILQLIKLQICHNRQVLMVGACPLG